MAQLVTYGSYEPAPFEAEKAEAVKAPPSLPQTPISTASGGAGSGDEAAGSRPISPASSASIEEESATTETVIIFDWDDTLMSSSWLASQGYRLDSPDYMPAHVAEHLAALQDSVLDLLSHATAFGRLVIITNAETGWVELSAKKWMPRVVPFVTEARVISARSTYEPCYPDSPADWKVQAFWHEVATVREELGLGEGGAPASADTTMQVLSLGDSIHERLAILRVTEGLSRTRTKSVKFVERPDAAQLRRQVIAVRETFASICKHSGDLDLALHLA